MKNGHSKPSAKKTAEIKNLYPAVPPAMRQESKTTNVHSRSHAAHLEECSAEPHAKPAGNVLHGLNPAGRKQP